MTTVDRLATLRTVAAPILAEQRKERERNMLIYAEYAKQRETNFYTVIRYLGFIGEDETVDTIERYVPIAPDWDAYPTANNDLLICNDEVERFIKIPYTTALRDIDNEGWSIAVTVYTPDEVFRQAVARALIELGIIKE